ncbi:MAG TPA: M10 family metallopeptidase C-terminal domain-containing protein [Allosphingosinicella sp.]|nr:M10 family metallopeptidase C-terminal domain-containing protein [Allosphingosinicella sp.]
MDIQGTQFDDYLVGTGNPDVISGLGGNDTLDGGAGADDLSGGQGNDVYIVDNGADVVRELLGEGADLVYTSVSYALGAGQEIETLSTQAHGGTAAINLIGNEFAQTIYGNFGANVIDGRGGADVMAGFAGDDTYVVDNALDQVLEGAGQGNDAIFTSTSYVLSSNQEIETLSTQTHAGTDDLFLTGNQYNNTLIGNAGDNIINGVGGADVMIGLDGDDTYAIDDLGDLVIDLENQGNDLVLTYLSHTLSNGNQIETLSTVFHQGTDAINLGGNDYNNTLIGNYGANYLNGNGGADTMIGLNGDDTYVADNIGDVVQEGAGGGSDLLYSFVSYTLAAGQEVETISTAVQGGTTAIDLTGNEFAQTIVGNAGANVIDGKGGNDVLYGLGGADTFAFTTALGAGNVDTLADFVAGTDKIQLGGAAGQPFLTLATGALRAGTLVIGAAALDADDYLIYNSGTGALLFDADGNGAGAAVQFATLATGLTLTTGDFLISGAANAAPAITSGATAQIAENSAASTIVYQVAASDADGDRITYSLTGADAALLTIDASGAVRLIAPADFETKTTYSFSVVASDSGLSASKAVTLTVTDVAESSGTPTINETATPNDSTGTAQAIPRATLVIAANPNLPDDDLPSATILGGLSSSNDQDFFSITLQAGEKLVLDIDGTTNSLDSFLTLYGTNGLRINDNDDADFFDPGSNPPFGHNTDSQIIFRPATGGTYYFSVGSFEGTSSGNYQLHVSIGPVATAAQLIAEDVDALVSGAAWNHPNLTFGFPTLASQYPADFDEVSPPTQFEAFNGTQQAATIQLLQLVANVTNLTFAQNSANPGQADLRFAESSEADVAYAYYPTNQGPLDQGGTAWFNHTNFNNPVRGNYAWMGILHEAGHALGLKHGHEFPLAISADRDSLEYSVMTYRSYPGGSIDGGYQNETFGFAQTLMMYDVAALQKIYGGANWTFNNTNSVYTWSATTGEMSINGVGQGAPGANRVFMTVWDGGGNDTYDLSAYANGTTIDLRPGEWTTTSQNQIANLGQGHFARGNVANALLFEGNTASLIENAIGGASGDFLIANQAANQLRGNGGGDAFIWKASGDAGTGVLADTILDFLPGVDRIDLSEIDAIPATGAPDNFTFIGTAAFHNVAGELRYAVTGGNAHIFADLDGNGVADMEIIVNNVTVLAGTDFTF